MSDLSDRTGEPVPRAGRSVLAVGAARCAGVDAAGRPMSLLTQAGLVMLAVATLLGWAVLAQYEAPRLLERVGVTKPRRILQMHLDYVMMALILVAVGAVLPDLPSWNQAALLLGTVVNPLLFLPLAFDERIATRTWYRLAGVVSFTAMSAGTVGAAYAGLSA